MNRLLILSANDFRMVFRDSLLRIFLFMPLSIFAVVKWGLPILISVFPIVQEYDEVILMLACMQTSTMFGFINGFVFLEEKDENVFSALRVMPVSAATLIAFRMAVGIMISVLINWLVLAFGDVIKIEIIPMLLIAFQYSLLAPLLSLLLAVFARNKVEGLAQFKVFNLVLNLPILIYFLPAGWLHGLAIIPTYWSFRSMESVLAGGNFMLYYSVGVCFYLLLLLLLVRIFERKVF